MDEIRSKEELLEWLHEERQGWEALLAEIGEARMELPGAMGNWTVKDTLAHLTTWWRREVAGLAAVRRGEQPEAHPSQADVQIINHWIYLTNRDRPIAAVLRDAAETWQELEKALEVFAEPDLMQPGRFAWLPDEALGPYTLHNYVNHLHEEHEPLIREWQATLEK